MFAEDGSNFARITMINRFTWEIGRWRLARDSIRSEPFRHPYRVILSLAWPNLPLWPPLATLSISTSYRPVLITVLLVVLLRLLSSLSLALRLALSPAYSFVSHWPNANFEKPSALAINQVNAIQVRPLANRSRVRSTCMSHRTGAVITISHWPLFRSSPSRLRSLRLW